MGISPYVRKLRAQVGNELLFLPSVTAVIFDESRRLLLVRSKTTVVFECSCDDQTPHALDGEIEEFRWIARDELPSSRSPRGCRRYWKWPWEPDKAAFFVQPAWRPDCSGGL